MSEPLFEHPRVAFGFAERVPFGGGGETAFESTKREVAVRVDAEGLFVDGKLACPREKVESVTLRIDERFVVLVKVHAGQILMFKLSDAGDARRMLESLGVSPSRVGTAFAVSPQFEMADFLVTRAAFPILGSFALLSLIVYLAFHYLGAAAMAVPIGVGALISTLWSATRVEVGVDGLRVRWLWLEKYYAFSDIEEVAHDDGDTITLTLRSGRSVALQMTAPVHIADVVKRIEDGIAALKATPKAAEAPALRERITEASRVAELRRLGAIGQGDYRVAGLDREQLWAVVEDPANDAVVRANAAAALSGRLDDGDRRRLRVAASVTASPKVRVALETAATAASDEELAEALAQVEEVAR